MVLACSLFGRSTVKLQELVNQRNHALFGDSTEQRASASTTSASGTGSSEQTEAPSPPCGHGPTEQPELPVITEVCELDEADKSCPKCGGELTEMKGQSEDSEEINLIERRLVVRKHKRLKYRCGCNACVETAPGPEKLIPGGRYSVDFAVNVATDKYGDSRPWERQVKRFARDGLMVTATTLWDQCDELARWLAPLMPKLRAYLLTLSVLGADETWWRLMDRRRNGGTNKKWWAWSMATVPTRRAESAVRATGSPSVGRTVGANGLAQCAASSVRGRVAMGPARRRWLERIKHDSVARRASAPERFLNAEGFSLPANVAIEADDRRGLEKLCRYVARPPVASQRLKQLSDGRIAYQLKRAWSNGTTELVLMPNHMYGACHLEVQMHGSRHTSATVPTGATRRYNTDIDQALRAIGQRIRRADYCRGSHREIQSDLNNKSEDILDLIKDFDVQIQSGNSRFAPRADGCGDYGGARNHGPGVTDALRRNGAAQSMANTVQSISSEGRSVDVRDGKMT